MSKTYHINKMLPSLPALRAFDTAARLGSFRAASEQLSVTPTAISHHIRTLEDQLGTTLFERVGRTVTLTEDGRRLAATTSQAFGMLSETVSALRRTARKAVRIAAGPTFAARWLMPRISDFWEKHSDIELEVVPTHLPNRTDRSDVDIVIRWDRLQEMPPEIPKLIELQPVAVASPEFAASHGPFSHPSDVLRLPLLHQRNHWGWRDWFDALGVTAPGDLRGVVVEDANVLLRAAVEGQGVVLGWLPMVEQDLREGRLQRLFDEEITPTHGYFMEIQGDHRPNKQVRTVCEWLLSA